MRLSLLLLTLSFISKSYGQSPFLKISLYFDNDVYALTDEHREKLSSAYADLSDKTISKVIIRGNTDANADSVYNIKLSDNRAKSVSTYLTGLGLSPALFLVDHYGENKPIGDNTTEEGRRLNRRVDVIFVYQEKKPSPEVTIIEETKPEPTVSKDSCAHDTIIYFANGASMRLNVCEFEEKKECLNIEIFNTPEAIQEAGLTTYTDDNTPLESGGMVFFPTCESGCFKKPAFMRLPVPCNNASDMLLYAMDENGNWTDPRNTVKVVRVNGELFYEFPVPCDTINNKNSQSPSANPDKVNVDKPVKSKKNKKPKFSGSRNRGTYFNVDKPVYSKTNSKLFRNRTFIKAKDGLKLQRVEITGGCPLGSYDLTITKNGKKAKISKALRGSLATEVRITAIDKDSTLITGFRSVRSLAKTPKNPNEAPKPQKKYTVYKRHFIQNKGIDNVRF